MPSIFKALASITVWVLFVFGCVAILMFLVMGTITGVFFGAGPPPLTGFVGAALGIASLILAVVAMKLRQMLE